MSRLCCFLHYDMQPFNPYFPSPTNFKMCGLRSLPIFQVNIVLAEMGRNTYLLNKLSSEQTDIIPWSFFVQGGFAALLII